MHLTKIQKRLVGWITSVLWLPTVSYAYAETSVQSGSALTVAAIHYQNEIIVSASIITAILGAVLAAFWNPPDELAPLIQRNNKYVNVLSSIAGAIGAFIYMLHHDNRLTILHPLWVLGMSFATPLALQVAIPKGVQVLSKYLARFLGSGDNQNGT